MCEMSNKKSKMLHIDKCMTCVIMLSSQFKRFHLMLQNFEKTNGTIKLIALTIKIFAQKTN